MKEFSLEGLTPWELEVIHKYPEIYLYRSDFVQSYIDRGLIKPEEACNLRYGFEFPEKWRPLAEEIGEFGTALVNLLRKSGIQDNAFIKSCIFKEKFFSLRWQGEDNLEGVYADIWNRLVRDIEEKSTREPYKL